MTSTRGFQTSVRGTNYVLHIERDVSGKTWCGREVAKVNCATSTLNEDEGCRVCVRRRDTAASESAGRRMTFPTSVPVPTPVPAGETQGASNSSVPDSWDGIGGEMRHDRLIALLVTHRVALEMRLDPERSFCYARSDGLREPDPAERRSMRAAHDAMVAAGKRLDELVLARRSVIASMEPLREVLRAVSRVDGFVAGPVAIEEPHLWEAAVRGFEGVESMEEARLRAAEKELPVAVVEVHHEQKRGV